MNNRQNELFQPSVSATALPIQLSVELVQLNQLNRLMVETWSETVDFLNPLDALSDLESAGFTFERDGDRLIVSPGARLTDANRVAIREAKPFIMDVLAARVWDFAVGWQVINEFWAESPTPPVNNGRPTTPPPGVKR